MLNQPIIPGRGQQRRVSHRAAGHLHAGGRRLGGHSRQCRLGHRQHQRRRDLHLRHLLAWRLLIKATLSVSGSFGIDVIYVSHNALAAGLNGAMVLAANLITRMGASSPLIVSGMLMPIDPSNNPFVDRKIF